METANVFLLSAILVVNLIGGGVLVRWLVRHIGALEGTVATQAKTLQTVEGLNTTVLNVIKAIDPDRWAREVSAYKELIDSKAAAFIEEERRKIARQQQGTVQQVGAVLKMVADENARHYKLILSLLPFVPKANRLAAIRGADLSEPSRQGLLQSAESAPEWSLSLTGGLHVTPQVGDLSAVPGTGVFTVTSTPMPPESPRQ
jgi:hypothetical protein